MSLLFCKMNNKKTIFLDTSILLEIAKSPGLVGNVCKFIDGNDYTLVIGIMNLIEIQKWKRYWHGVTSFISSVPFVISKNSEYITKAEVEHYPNEASLPIALASSDFPYSREQTIQAFEINLNGKIAGFERNYRNQYRTIWQSFIDNRQTFLPENGKSYTNAEVKTFFLITVMQWLYLDGYQHFLQREASAGRVINLECFKSIYLPLLGIFVEYFINKKNGKPSDVGDFYQLSIIPYVSLAVLDNERNSLIQNINKRKLFAQRFETYNHEDFQRIVNSK